MKVKCCDCGKTYEYDMMQNVVNTFDLEYGNMAQIVKCPHCGLMHLVVWAKIREATFPELKK